MHIHRLEKIWLIIGIVMLGVFLVAIGIGAFAMGNHPPGHSSAIKLDPEKVYETPPFDNPGLEQIGENEYNAYIVAYIYGYNPGNIEIPVGATVHFYVTSADVVHGFNIPGTIVNMMAVPGEVNEMTYTFDEPAEYLLLCNEYCGIGHEYMATIITVKG